MGTTHTTVASKLEKRCTQIRPRHTIISTNQVTVFVVIALAILPGLALFQLKRWGVSLSHVKTETLEAALIWMENYAISSVSAPKQSCPGKPIEGDWPPHTETRLSLRGKACQEDSFDRLWLTYEPRTSGSYHSRFASYQSMNFETPSRMSVLGS